MVAFAENDDVIAALTGACCHPATLGTQNNHNWTPLGPVFSRLPAILFSETVFSVLFSRAYE
jgi:hypothetical protein